VTLPWRRGSTRSGPARSRTSPSPGRAVLAGDHLIGLGEQGHSGVARVSHDGKQLNPIGTNRLGDKAWFSYGVDQLAKKFAYGCQPFASGNRIFIRSYTDLYCVGDPQATMVLSPAHR
jgi:hypothetical protein